MKGGLLTQRGTRCTLWVGAGLEVPSLATVGRAAHQQVSQPPAVVGVGVVLSPVGPPALLPATGGLKHQLGGPGGEPQFLKARLVST